MWTVALRLRYGSHLLRISKIYLCFPIDLNFNSTVGDDCEDTTGCAPEFVSVSLIDLADRCSRWLLMDLLAWMIEKKICDFSSMFILFCGSFYFFSNL